MLKAVFLAFIFHAHAELSAFERSLQNETRVKTQESVEQFGGVTFRKVVTDDGTFYFKLLGVGGDVSELVCSANFKPKSPHVVIVAVQGFTRARDFTRALKEDCAKVLGPQRFSIDWSQANVELGVRLPDSEDMSSKTLYTAPLSPQPNLGFGGSF